MFQYVLLTLLASIQIIWTLPLIIVQIFKIQMYKITEKSELNKIIDKLNVNKSSIICNDKPEGFIYGKWYIGFIFATDSERSKEKTLYILLKKSTFEKNDDTDVPPFLFILVFFFLNVDFVGIYIYNQNLTVIHVYQVR